MKFAYFLGCNIPARVSQYADATEAIFKKLEVDLVEFPEFNCCGYPARNIDQHSFVLSAARNLALAETAGLELMALCKCCYGSLKKAEYLMREDQNLKTEVNAILAKEKLRYEGRVKINHLLSVLYHQVGQERLKSLIARNFGGLQIAVSYGCHALRPNNVTGFDNPVSPKIFDELVEITGAFSVNWARKLDCCGAPLTGINDRLAMDMARKKITSAREAGAHFICTACPYTHLQLDAVQARWISDPEKQDHLAPILYPQLLGLSMAIDAKTLGLSKNKLDLNRIQSFLTVEQ